MNNKLIVQETLISIRQHEKEDFNSIEFDGIRNKSGVNSFILTPKQWINSTNAIGIISKSGRYGGTFAHKDIAFEFASWISTKFKLFLIKEFQRLKNEEIENPKQDGNLRDYASVEQLIVLSNMESVNAELIKQDMQQADRLLVLNSMAISQMKSLINNPTIKKLGK